MSKLEQPITLTKSQIAEEMLEWEGKPFSLENYPIYRPIYDGDYKSMLFKMCRQVGKSITSATFSIAESLAIPYFKTYYIAPSEEHTRRYSSQRVGPFIQYSRKLRDARLVSTDSTSRVLERKFANGSILNFSYAMDTADRCRGPTADRVWLDEVQDMVVSIVEPVVRESLKTSKYMYMTYSGTPKTMENGIEELWQASTQTEWAVRCDSCGRYSILVSEKQCRPQGPICMRCEALLDPRQGLWVDTHPNARDMPIKGFHVSEPSMILAVPKSWRPGTEEHALAVQRWGALMQKLEGKKPYPLMQFRNEVLGVSDAVGSRLVTKEILLRACDGPMLLEAPSFEDMRGITHCAAGLDWSGGGEQGTSRTVLTILGQAGNRRRLLFYRVFPGNNPMVEMDEILRVLALFRAHFPNMTVAGDRGGGQMYMDILRTSVRHPELIYKIQYAGPQARYLVYNQKGNYHLLNRTAAIDSAMNALLRQEHQFPKDHAAMDVFFEDILALTEDVTRSGHKIWTHPKAKPDDCLHSLVYARFALQAICGELDLTAYTVDDDEGPPVKPVAKATQANINWNW